MEFFKLVEALLQINSCFFAQYKNALLTAINSHSLAAVCLPKCVFFNSHMWQNAFYRYLK